jgi:hypothetical protein
VLLRLLLVLLSSCMNRPAPSCVYCRLWSGISMARRSCRGLHVASRGSTVQPSRPFCATQMHECVMAMPLPASGPARDMFMVRGAGVVQVGCRCFVSGSTPMLQPLNIAGRAPQPCFLPAEPLQDTQTYIMARTLRPSLGSLHYRPRTPCWIQRRRLPVLCA